MTYSYDGSCLSWRLGIPAVDFRPHTGRGARPDANLQVIDSSAESKRFGALSQLQPAAVPGPPRRRKARRNLEPSLRIGRFGISLAFKPLLWYRCSVLRSHLGRVREINVHHA